VQNVVEAAIVQAVSVNQAEDFLAVGTELVGQMDLLGEMIEHQEGAIELDLFHLDFGERSGEQSLAIGFATEVANMALDTLALDPLILDFGEINPALAFDAADKAHSVHNVH
jgi:hypothetical protein